MPFHITKATSLRFPSLQSVQVQVPLQTVLTPCLRLSMCCSTTPASSQNDTHNKMQKSSMCQVYLQLHPLSLWTAVLTLASFIARASNDQCKLTGSGLLVGNLAWMPSADYMSCFILLQVRGWAILAW